ncbi:MAG: efflux RND transporter permease subunit [Deltaproteobacteria bacterium]|nr:efflux RND transporter permease subunit [Deltaproteobacteria bacterium]MBW2398410.1 efflux RND transporter permease subunit [Deltaproteobacteria bacterium]
MDIAKAAIENRVVTLVLTTVMIGGGLISFEGLSRLEDPEFTIKEALIITPYPGASAREVEEEVTDEIETAVQALAQLKELESKSDRELSNITVVIKNKYDASTLPQVWDELRRKVDDAQSKLPPGAGPSLVVDDFGDVFGVFIAIFGDEYSYAELKEYVDVLRRELLLVQDVAKIETFGERVEAIYVDLNRDRMSQLGIPIEVIVDQLRQKNLAASAGHVQVGPEFISIVPTGMISSIADFESLLISRGTNRSVYLRDVATVRRTYVEPLKEMIRYDGRSAIGLGISTVSGGNVVVMGEALKQRLEELTPLTPLGIEAGIVSMQSDAVSIAINSFVVSLLQAVVIVIVVLLFFMGLRSGLLIGFVLFVTISGTFIFMGPMGVALERISLGALIIALGMLVDNAIVIVDGVLIRQQKGEDTAEAASAVVKQSAIPLLGATVIAILAFAAIGTSDDSTGEFCRSLFQVVLISLSLSWVTAVTVTPLLCVMFLPPPDKSGADEDPYGGALYRGYRGFVRGCIRARWLTVGVVLGLFALSLWGFGYIDQSFFPPSTRPQFLLDLWLPQGTHIDETRTKVEEVEEYLAPLEGVEHVTSLIGKGGLRFLLTYTPEKSNPAYAQLLIDVDGTQRIDELIPVIEQHLADNHPDILSFCSRFELGPGANGKIRARISGPDPIVLRELGDEVRAIFRADGNAKGIRSDWRQRVKVIEPVIADEQASLNGITRTDIARTLLASYEGASVGVYRDGDLLLPIVLRVEEEQRTDVASLQGIQIWSSAAERMIPLRQVVSDFRTVSEDEIIMRRDRSPTITIFADPIDGPATRLFDRLRPQIEAMPLPTDYALEWGGEYEDSKDAQGPLMASLPVFVLIMLLVTVSLFNSLKQPAIIWLCVPLAIIGVTLGLLLTNQPFGFMALLGFLSLMGMLIKNAVVLIDEINLQLSEGKELLPAILDSGTSRLRPVAMAAATTALGMIPLLMDAFFISMAVTIIFGLIFATLLTMVVVPVLYAIFYGASEAEGS